MGKIMKTKSQASIYDIHVSTKIRAGRKLKKKTQKEIASILSVSPQQVQKYEDGKNRVSAGQLYLISTFLEFPIHFFFEDMPVQKPINTLIDRT